jgi:rsbT co-antagonist protein RsbR
LVIDWENCAMITNVDTDEETQAQIVALRQQLERLEERLQVYEKAFNGMPIGFMMYYLEDHNDPGSLRLIFTNQAMRLVSGFDIDAEIGKLITTIFPNALESGLAQIYAGVAQLGQERDLGEVQYGDNRVTPATFAVRAFQPRQDYVCVMVENVSERKRAEEALRQIITQEETIRAQQAALTEVSTPLLTISDTTVVLPLVGAVDSRRVAQMMDTLLNGVSASGAAIVILDITGVSIVDTQVADAFIRASQAVSLLGAQVVLTGIRPEVAQTLVQLGVDLRSIITRGTLQDGITYALRN